MLTYSNHCYTLITGASAGIGKQLAIEFAKRGNNLFLVALPESGLEAFSNELQKEYSIDVRYFCINLTKSKSPSQVYKFAKSNLLHINILVNNAGIGFEGRFENLSPKQIDSILLLNVRVLTLLTYYFLPEMKVLDKAFILNISSFAGRTPIPFKCLYSASKGFIWYFSQALNTELRNTKIKILSVYPSGVRTERVLEKIKNSSLIANITVMNPDEVARLAVAGLLHGKKVLIPGLFTKIYYLIGYVLPQGLILKLTSSIFRKYA